MMSSFQCHVTLSVVLIVASSFGSVLSANDSIIGDDADHFDSPEKKSLFECKKQNESCRVLPMCCEALHCFWEEGLSLIKYGVCVECVGRKQTCQSDSQCCRSLVCQKNNMYNINGVCDLPRPLSSDCYKDSQCTSGHCDVSWIQKLVASSGRCIG